MNEIEYRLQRPFPANRISWRVGSVTKAGDKGMPLAYIDARDVMQRLDKVIGIGKWQCRYPENYGGLLICEIGIKFDGELSSEWVWKANGAGDTQVEAEKGKASDAFKRSAVLWGIGRYLYELPNQWVALENRRFKRGVEDMLGETLPHWATPEGFDKAMLKRGKIEKEWITND